MTGRFLQAYNKIKSYVVRPAAGEGEDDGRGDTQFGRQNGGVHQQRSFVSSFFPFVNNRKRRAEEIATEIELEITDDEDDPTELNGRFSQRYHLLPKRFRPTESGNIFSGERSPQRNNFACESMAEQERRYVTRGSGINPAIKGLDKQPWMFNFKSKTPSKDKVSVVEVSRGTLYGSTSSSQEPNNPGPSKGFQHSSSSLKNSKEKSSDCFKNFRFQNPKEIPVITLDNDEEQNNSQVLPETNATTSKDRRGTPRIETKLKVPMKSTAKMSFMSSFPKLGVGTRNTYSSNTIRPNEKMQYANLLKRMTNYNGLKSLVSKKFSGALETSKLHSVEVTAKYNNFESPEVAFSLRRYGQRYGSPYPHTSSFQHQLSTLDKHQNCKQALSKTIAPELIDISFEHDEEHDNSKALVVKPPNGTVNSGTPKRSFHDLNEALNSNISSDSSQNSETNDASCLAIEGQQDSKEDDDPDFSVISKSVLQAKPRTRRLNSLALEHENVPYANKNWLEELSSSWREEQKHREVQISENMETIDVLQKESTIEKDLRERMRKKLTMTEIIVLEEQPPSYPEITSEMQQIIDTARRPGYDSDVLATVFNVDVTRGDITTLGPCKWLNDNVINVYMELISLRSKQEASYPTVYAFSTFFYPKLIKEGYSNALKRWTRKVDIFENDLLVFPIHLGMHWCLAAVDFRKTTIKYYDSLGGRNNKCLQALLNYLAAEKKERKGQLLNKEEWTLENVPDVPQQENGSDCGMFSCKFAEYLSRDAELTFAQENMNYYRERMIYEILKSDLLYP